MGKGPFICIITFILIILIILIYRAFQTDEDVNLEKRVELINTDKCIPPISPYFYVSNELENLRINQSSADLILYSSGIRIPVHKIILAAHSRTFERQILAREANDTGDLFVSDVTTEALLDLLNYMYTNTPPDMTKLSDGLLVAADRYQINTLKCVIEEELCGDIDIQNAAHLLYFSLEANATRLQYKASAFILKHISNIVNTQAWKELTKLKPTLMHIALESVANHSTTATPNVNCRILYEPDYIVTEKLREFFVERKFADDELNIAGEIIHINRAILIEQSIVLREILNSKASHHLELGGVNANAIKDALLYLYSGSVPTIYNSTEEVLSAAHLLQLDNLKCVCAKILITTLTHENAAHLLILAEKNNAVELKAAVVTHIVQNTNEVTKTEGWTVLSREHPELMTKAITDVHHS